MAKVPKTLSGPASPAGALATVYTVPAATKTIVRMVNAVNTATSASNAWSININGGQVVTNEALAGSTSVTKWFYIPMEVGAIIQTTQVNTGGNDIKVTITGDEISV